MAIFFQNALIHSFFLTHQVILNLIQDLTYFFKMVFDSFFFLFLPYFYFFIKIIITSHRKGGLSQSPKPDSSPSYNLPLLGHGLGCYPKNPLTSEIEVSSVSYEQIRVVIFLKCFDSFFSFFNTPCHPEFDSGSHFYFFKNSF